MSRRGQTDSVGIFPTWVYWLIVVVNTGFVGYGFATDTVDTWTWLLLIGGVAAALVLWIRYMDDRL